MILCCLLKFTVVLQAVQAKNSWRRIACCCYCIGYRLYKCIHSFFIRKLMKKTTVLNKKRDWHQLVLGYLHLLNALIYMQMSNVVKSSWRLAVYYFFMFYILFLGGAILLSHLEGRTHFIGKIWADVCGSFIHVQNYAGCRLVFQIKLLQCLWPYHTAKTNRNEH